MRTSLSLVRNGAALIALALSACTGEIHDVPVTCGGSEALRAAYDAAYAWGEQGAANASCDDERCATPALEGLRANANEEAASCVLAGTFEGLRRGCRHGHGHGHGGGHGGHHGGGHGGHHGGGHGGGGGDDGELQQCRDDGRFTGEAAALVFCELSISLGGLGVDERLTPGQETACSQKFENACTRAFDRAVERYGQLIGDASADCRPFAQGEFAEAYEVQRFNQCLFAIGEAEPPAEDPCANGACECRDAASCELGCEGEGCDLTCERAATCDVTCGDDCDSACRDTSRCEVRAEARADLTCERVAQCALSVADGNVTCRDTSSCAIQADEQAKVTCERTAKCEVDCPDCDVQCRDVASCEVHVTRGRVRCDRVGQCQVECVGGGQMRPKRCSDGSYVCGGSCQ